MVEDGCAGRGDEDFEDRVRRGEAGVADDHPDRRRLHDERRHEAGTARVGDEAVEVHLLIVPLAATVVRIDHERKHRLDVVLQQRVPTVASLLGRAVDVEHEGRLNLPRCVFLGLRRTDGGRSGSRGDALRHLLARVDALGRGDGGLVLRSRALTEHRVVLLLVRLVLEGHGGVTGEGRGVEGALAGDVDGAIGLHAVALPVEVALDRRTHRLGAHALDLRRRPVQGRQLLGVVLRLAGRLRGLGDDLNGLRRGDRLRRRVRRRLRERGTGLLGHVVRDDALGGGRRGRSGCGDPVLREGRGALAAHGSRGGGGSGHRGRGGRRRGERLGGVLGGGLIGGGCRLLSAKGCEGGKGVDRHAVLLGGHDRWKSASCKGAAKNELGNLYGVEHTERGALVLEVTATVLVAHRRFTGNRIGRTRLRGLLHLFYSLCDLLTFRGEVLSREFDRGALGIRATLGEVDDVPSLDHISIYPHRRHYVKGIGAVKNHLHVLDQVLLGLGPVQTARSLMIQNNGPVCGDVQNVNEAVDGQARDEEARHPAGDGDALVLGRQLLAVLPATAHRDLRVDRAGLRVQMQPCLRDLSGL